MPILWASCHGRRGGLDIAHNRTPGRAPGGWWRAGATITRLPGPCNRGRHLRQRPMPVARKSFSSHGLDERSWARGRQSSGCCWPLRPSAGLLQLADCRRHFRTPAKVTLHLLRHRTRPRSPCAFGKAGNAAGVFGVIGASFGRSGADDGRLSPGRCKCPVREPDSTRPVGSPGRGLRRRGLERLFAACSTSSSRCPARVAAIIVGFVLYLVWPPIGLQSRTWKMPALAEAQKYRWPTNNCWQL